MPLREVVDANARVGPDEIGPDILLDECDVIPVQPAGRMVR